MHHHRLILVLGFPLLLAACFPVQKKQDVQSSSSASSATSSIASVAQKSAMSSVVSKEVMKRGIYGVYQDGVIGTQQAVLFFHAAWCPECRESDAELRSLYDENPPAISTYKVDYDTATELKQRYGVVTQHTFVLLAADGTALKTIIGPSHEKLLSLLK